MTFSPEMARALAPKADSFYKAGGHKKPRLHVPSRPCSFTAEEIPPLLPSEWFRMHFGPLAPQLPPRQGWTERHLRRAASLKLVEMAAGGTWPESASYLGLSWNTAQHSLRVLRRVLTSSELWAAFDQAIEQVACHLDSDEDRINFTRRRKRLMSWRLTEDDWITLRHGLKGLRGRVSASDSRPGTVAIWAQATQADHLHSPVLDDIRLSGASTQPVVSALNQLWTPANQRGANLQLFNRLSRCAAHIGRACDQELDDLTIPIIQLVGEPPSPPKAKELRDNIATPRTEPFPAPG
ncbi:hypothetical protein ACFVJM_00335 [Streptomyces virginiae]|uniref:hypothetical protein n=1 Tax=Streptomyces virginiae TaxID=1961 RepID=UPI003634B2D4